MAVNVVSATAPVNATGTSVTASLPSSILAGDVVIAFVTSTGGLTPTPPAGFTFQHEVTCAAGAVSQRTNYYENFSVGPSDSGTSKTFTVPSSETLSVVFVHLRSDTGRGIKRRSAQNNSFNNVTDGAAFVWGFTNNSFEKWLLVACVSQALPLTASTAIPTQTDLTGFFGPQTDMRLWGYYSTVNYSQDEVFTGRYVPITNTASNGPAAITVVYSDKKGPDDAYDEIINTDTPKHAWTAKLTDGVVSSDAISRVIGLFLADTVRGTDAHVSSTKYFTELADQAALADALRRGVPTALADTVGISRAISAIRALTVIEQLSLTETVAGAAKYRVTALERIQLADSLQRFFGAGLTDGVSVAEVVSQFKRVTSNMTEAVALSSALVPKFVLRVDSQDGVQITDAEVLKFVFKPVVVEGLEITAAYLSPSGNFTTWAVNTETGATTEYTNFAFNSFAQVGHKAMATSNTGLYELVGDTDNGADIIAAIKSGYMQMNDSRFTGLKAVYLGVRGGGEYFLKLETPQGSTTYRVLAEDMATTKVWVGKGLRTRYLSFELISTGQDFDLESIEFVPMRATRRV